MGTRRFFLCVLFASTVGILSPLLVTAQTRGNTITQPYQFTFKTSGQSMWGPADAPANIDYRYSLWDVTWNVPTRQTGDVVTVVDWDFGGRIRGSTGGATGLAVRFHNVETGSVDLVYPVDIVVTLPEPNSFRDGDTVTIGSAYSLGPGWSFTTAPPAIDVTFDGRFGFQASSSVDVCLFGCTGFPLTPTINIPNSNFDVMTLSGAAGTVALPAIPGATVQALPHTFTFLESNFHGIGGTVDRPRVMTSASVQPDGYGLSATGSHTYIDISIDWDSYTTKVTRVPLGADTPNIGGASAFYDIMDVRSLITLAESKALEFLPDLRLTAVLPMVVDYTVKDGTGAVVTSGTASTFEFKVGHSVDVAFPLGMKDPLRHVPTYALNNTFTSTTTGEVTDDLVMTVLQLGLTVPTVVVVPEICDPTGVLGCTPEVKSPKINLGLGPLYRQTLASETFSVPFYPGGTWQLQGLAAMTGDPFFLDPENPIVTVATSFNSSVLENTGPPGTLTQTIHVRNDGDVKLSTVALADALQWALWYEDGGPYYIPVDHAGEYPEIFVLSSIISDHLTLVDDFDGSEILNRTTLATGADMLEVGQTATIKIVMTSLHDRLYGASLSTSGVSPIGTLVNSTGWGSLGVFKLDIDACKLPRRWRHKVSGYIAGTHLMDVNTVDLTSLRIEGVAPTEVEVSGYGDYGRIWLEFNQDILVDSLRARLKKMTVAPGAIVAMEGTSGPDMAEAISAEDVAEQMLDGTALLDRQQINALDELGNQNGQFDLGDLRALLLAQGAILDESSVTEPTEPDVTISADKTGGRLKGNRRTDNRHAANVRRRRGHCQPRHGYVSVPAIITGNFVDGTPFIGEDLVNIREED